MHEPLPGRASPLTRSRQPLPARAFAPLILMLLLLVTLAAGWHAPAGAARHESTDVLESRVKAAFLYKFASYVEWPPGMHTRSPLVIGVVGADEVARELAQLASARPYEGRPLLVRRIGEGEPPGDLHMLFIGRNLVRPLDPLLRRAQQDSVLTVTEGEDAHARGSVINFKLVEGRVRFDVSLIAAEQAGLRLSSRLLAVAHRVKRNGG